MICAEKLINQTIIDFNILDSENPRGNRVSTDLANRMC
jgi:hypothetical protein